MSLLSLLPRCRSCLSRLRLRLLLLLRWRWLRPRSSLSLPACPRGALSSCLASLLLLS